MLPYRISSGAGPIFKHRACAGKADPVASGRCPAAVDAIDARH